MGRSGTVSRALALADSGHLPSVNRSVPFPRLGRKQSSDHQDWLETWDWIRAHPDHKTAAALVDEAASRVRRRLAGVDRAAYGWSGGKDSIGLQVVMEAAGVTDAVMVISALEYPAFLAWATDHMPWGLHVQLQTAVSIEWLAANPKMLFPTDSATAGKWFAKIQHSGQRIYAAQHGIQVMMLGRRLGDGNQVGTYLPGTGWERTSRGVTRYSPIADWTHEDLLNVIVCNQRDLPPCYTWPRGFRVGTGAWPARQWTRSRQHGWSEVLSIDPQVVENAARYGIPGAKEALACAG